MPTNDVEKSNTMSEKLALELAVTELKLDEWVARTFLPVDMNVAQKRVPKAELWAAEEIVAMMGGRLTYVNGANRWHIWDGKIHLPCEGDAIALAIIQLYYKMIAEAMEHVRNHMIAQAGGEMVEGEEDAYKNAIKKYNAMFFDHKKFRDKLANTQTQKGVMSQLKVLLGVESTHYDDDRRWFVLNNGVIDAVATAEKGEAVFLAHDPSRPVWRYFDAEYHPEADARWLKYFLKTSLADESQGRFLQRTMGAALIGAPVKTKTIVDAFGATNSGKSMFNTVLEKLCGEYYVEVTEPAVAAHSRDGDRYRDEMRTARIVTVLEVKSKLDKSFILKYTGGDTIETSAKYRNNIKWKPQGVIVMMSNEGMNIESQEEAVSDRIERINFPHTFSANPTEEKYKINPELPNYIMAERDGFVTWLIEGYLDYLKNNVDGKPIPSESMAMLKLEMQEEENSFAIFWDIYDDVQWKVKDGLPASKMMPWMTCYGKYEKWCQATGHPKMGKTDAKKWAERQGYVARISNQNRLVNREPDNMATIIGY